MMKRVDDEILLNLVEFRMYIFFPVCFLCTGDVCEEKLFIVRRYGSDRIFDTSMSRKLINFLFAIKNLLVQYTFSALS
jgi:hypothetical protein